MIAMHRQGKGRDLFMLPGWGMHRGMWGGLPACLADSVQVHVCELPGYGDNDARVADLETLIDQLAANAPNKVDVLGWSLGGMLAMLWAARFPQQVERLILIGSTPSFIVRENWRSGTPPEVLGNFAIALRVDPADLMQNFLRGMSEGERDAQQSMQTMTSLFEQFPLASREALNAGLEWLRDIDLRKDLPRMEQKVFLVHGEQDVITSVTASKRMSKQLKNSRLQLIETCGHAPHLSHADMVCRAIQEFLND